MKINEIMEPRPIMKYLNKLNNLECGEVTNI